MKNLSKALLVCVLPLTLLPSIASAQIKLIGTDTPKFETKLIDPDSPITDPSLGSGSGPSSPILSSPKGDDYSKPSSDVGSAILGTILKGIGGVLDDKPKGLSSYDSYPGYSSSSWKSGSLYIDGYGTRQLKVSKSGPYLVVGVRGPRGDEYLTNINCYKQSWAAAHNINPYRFQHNVVKAVCGG